MPKAKENGGLTPREPSKAQMMLRRRLTPKNENVFLFIPNLIGYTRVILAAASLVYMGAHPKACSFLYVVSCLLDAVDGQAARYFGQSRLSVQLFVEADN